MRPPMDLRRSRCSVLPLGLLVGLALLLSAAGGRLIAQRPSTPRPAATAAVTTATFELYRQHCAACHGADGRGKAASGRAIVIPDFTEVSWQKRRTDAQLLASILDGRGRNMPPWRGQLSAEQAHDLVAHVRAFAPTIRKPETGTAPEAVSFEERYRRLQEEFDELRRQFRAAAEAAAAQRAEPSESSPGPPPARFAEESPGSAPANPLPPTAFVAPTNRALLRPRCAYCHGLDGPSREVRLQQRPALRGGDSL